MKRLGRWLFNLAAAVSLGAFLACILAGAYSFIYVQQFDCSWRGVAIACHSVSGGVLIEWTGSTDPSWTIPSSGFPKLKAQTPVKLDGLSSLQALSAPAHGFPGLRWERQYLIKQLSLVQGQWFDNPTTKLVDSPVLMPELRRGRRGMVRYRVGVTWWMPALLTILLPLAWLKSRRNSRNAAVMRLCAVCGYDLRATPDRCPECGTVPGSANATA